MSASTHKILLACRGIAANQGIGQIRVDKVAAAADVNKRMIYHYFGNKQGLEQCLLDWQLFEVLEVVPSNGTTERLLGKPEFDQRWPDTSEDADAGQLAAKIILQKISGHQMEIEEVPDNWARFCVELMTMAVFGVSESSLETPHEQTGTKPRFRLPARTRQGAGTNRS